MFAVGSRVVLEHHKPWKSTVTMHGVVQSWADGLLTIRRTVHDIDPNVLQDPANVAATVRFVLSMPEESVIPEVMVLPLRETSWP